MALLQWLLYQGCLCSTAVCALAAAGQLEKDTCSACSKLALPGTKTIVPMRLCKPMVVLEWQGWTGELSTCSFWRPPGSASLDSTALTPGHALQQMQKPLVDLLVACTCLTQPPGEWAPGPDSSESQQNCLRGPKTTSRN